MSDPVEELVAALSACRKTFDGYVEIHANKQTLDGDMKARANAMMVELCDAAISRFNAEREKGVWAPREPTEPMLHALDDWMGSFTGHWQSDREGWLEAYAAMIAAIEKATSP